MTREWMRAIEVLAGITTLAVILVLMREGAHVRESSRRWGARVRPPRRRVVLLVASVMCLAIAACLGSAEEGPRNDRSTGVTVFVLDVSRSMEGGDIAPSRKVAMFRFVHRALKNLPAGRIGLVAVAGEPVVLCPLTTDRGALDMAVTEAERHVDFAGGSILSDGVSAALDLAERSSAPLIVVLSDGEETAGEWDSVVSRVVRQHGRIEAIGIGTAKGATMHIDRNPTHDAGGETRVTRLDERNLEHIAARTGGQYVRWGPEAEQQLMAILGRGASPGTRQGSSWPWAARGLIVTAFVCLSLERARSASLSAL